MTDKNETARPTAGAAGSMSGGPAERRRFDALRARWERTRALLRAPRIQIETYGDAKAWAIHRSFTARHRRFKFTSAKRWGVALVELPSTPQAYVASISRSVRKQRTKAINAGYRHAVVRVDERLEEIFEVNTSSPSRQGRPMGAVYVERDRIVENLGAQTPIHAILAADGRLVAYANYADIGDAFALHYLIGHADHLAAGVMYLLVAEVVASCIAARRPDGMPRWLMADTFWGASPGLAYFKERAGFHMYTVDWVWRGEAAGAAVGS